MSISIPLNKEARTKRFGRSSEDKSIDSFIELIIATPKGECICDPEFGYLFSNLRFEIINETEELVNIGMAKVAEFSSDRSVYNKKISGESNSGNTFASELKSTIERYERRLRDVNVSMRYVRRRRSIDVKVTAIRINGGGRYTLNTKINIWN